MSVAAGWTLLAALPVAAVALALVIRRRRTGQHLAILRTLAQALFAMFVVAIAALTLGIHQGVGASIELVPIMPFLQQLADPATQAVAVRNLVGNILLFLPLGFTAPVAWPRLDDSVRVAFAAAVISGSIELSQFALKRSQAADINDVLVNVAGALLGFVLLRTAQRIPGRVALRP